jgi:hypothetical protein
VHSSIYDADRTLFITKRCEAFIRQARCGEFDYSPDSHVIAETYRDAMGFEPPLLPNEALRSVVKYIPKLWCLVSQIAPGTHSVTTAYRGDAFFRVYDFEGHTIADLGNADKLTLALEAMQDRKGYDAEAWKLYCTKLAEACERFEVATGAVTRNGLIH